MQNILLSRDNWWKIIDHVDDPQSILHFRLTCREAASSIAPFVPHISFSINKQIEQMKRYEKIKEEEKFKKVGQALPWLITMNKKPIVSKEAAFQAVALGQLSLIQWLYTHYPYIITWTLFDAATMYGHIDIVKWLHENFHEQYVSSYGLGFSK